MPYIITVKQGNLVLEADATFIVNASNTKLALGSGVSSSFREHCGVSLQQEMSAQYEKVPKPILQGDVIATSSAEAENFKYALHATVINYNTPRQAHEKQPSLETIQTILTNIEKYLKWYDEKTEEPMKLVLPLLGCGVGGLDKKDVIQGYKHFFRQEVEYVCEVVVYGFDRGDEERINAVLLESKEPHQSWFNYYDFVNEMSFGSFVEDLTSQTLELINETLQTKGQSIIDFGAGTGRLCVPLAMQGYELIAVEPSEGMLGVLKSKFEDIEREVVTSNTTLQDYEPQEEADLALAVFTVLAYITTDEEMDKAIQVMSQSIKEEGYLLIDLASTGLFRSSLLQRDNLNREIVMTPLNDKKYNYYEKCSGYFEGKEFSYEDEFTLRNWSSFEIIHKLSEAGFRMEQDLSDVFAGSGANYYLFKKTTT